MADSRGIVVIGPPRSGTTLLRRILDAHANIACPPETYLLSAAARFLHEERFAQGLQIGVLHGMHFAGMPEEQVLARLRDFSFGMLDDLAAAAGKKRWAEKTAFNAFFLEPIRRLCGGHVHWVCIQRHGLDVVGSLAELVAKTGGYVSELHGYLRDHPEPPVALAHAWVDAGNAVADLVAEEDRVVDVRYEDLVRRPDEVVGSIFASLGEEMDEGLIARALGKADQVGFGDWKTYARSVVDDSSVDRWKKMPGPVVEQLAPICNDTLERLGYERVQTADEDSEDARRRYELGLLVNRMKQQKRDE